jgi:hypothetical protein
MTGPFGHGIDRMGHGHWPLGQVRSQSCQWCLGLIFPWPIKHFRDKYALQMFEKGYAECSHEEKLQVRLQHKNIHSLTGTGLPENHRHVRQSKRVDYAVLESNTRRCPHRGGGRGCVYSPQRCTPSWRRPPTSGNLGTGIPWTTRIARAGGTTAIVWGMITAAVAGESWRSFGEVFGGAVVATYGAIAGGFALVYMTAMAPQWQGPYFPGGLAAYLTQSLRWPREWL